MPWERELEVLESSIRNLNAQYDAFLYGSSSKPPVEIRRRVNAMIRRLAGQRAHSYQQCRAWRRPMRIRSR